MTHFARRCLTFSLLIIILQSFCLQLFAAEPNSKTWKLESGPNVLELKQEGDSLTVSKLAPRDKKDALLNQMPLLAGSVDGAEIQPQDLQVAKVEQNNDKNNVATLTATLKHKKHPLEITVRYTAWADTGVFSSDIALKNVGSQPVSIDSCSSLYLQLNTVKPQLRYLSTISNVERNYESLTLEKPFELGNKLSGRSTSNDSTWWSLYEPQSKLSYSVQFGYSGNWAATFTPEKQKKLCDVKLRMIFDKNGPLVLQSGALFDLPRAAISVSTGNDISDCVLPLHRFLRKFVIPKQPANNPLLVTYNSWYSLGGTADAKNISQLIPLAAKIGCEAFVIDANWHYCPGNNTNDWSLTLGDWVINPKKYPNGLSPIIKLVHDHGMKFGIWYEPEVASINSNVLKEHPDWFLSLQGKPIIFNKKRVHLDFAKPEVRDYMTAAIDRMMKEGKVDWLKLDYNIQIGNDFDQATGPISGARLHAHELGYYQWLEELAKKYPHVIIENCASGGRRSDMAIMKYFHTSWISDTCNPRFSPQCAWGALAEAPPEICHHWMVGDAGPKEKIVRNAQIRTTDPRWWDFMFRIAMNGQFGVSSQLDLWPEEVFPRAKENIDLYKRIRTVIHGSDVYLLTDCPKGGYDPTDWLAIEYLQPSENKCVVLIYRLWKSESKKQFALRSLEANTKYSVSIDGKPASERMGSDLMKNGINVELEKEGYSQVIELNAVK